VGSSVANGMRRWGRRCVLQGPPAGPLEIVELAGPQGPQEACQPEATEAEGDRHEPRECSHFSVPFFRCASRKALAVTASEDADMAIAAIRGVTRPATASGTNTRL
jgi:hypothetical protein